MKHVLFALVVLVVAAWTTPVFGQEASLLDQVKGKTEAEVVTFMEGLTDEQLASLIAQAINAANNDPTDAAKVALRALVLSAGNKVLNAKPTHQQNTIIAAIQDAAPGTKIGKDAQNMLFIIPPTPAPPPMPPPPPPFGSLEEKQSLNQLQEKLNYDSQPAGR